MIDGSDLAIFVEIAERLGCRRNDLASFLDFIDAPSELICLQQVIENVNKLFPHMLALISKSPVKFDVSEDEIKAWSWVAEIVLDSDDAEFDAIKNFTRKTLARKRPPLMQYLVSNPAYSLLCHSGAEKHNDKFYLYQALALLIDITIRKQGGENDVEFGDVRYSFLLEVRRLAESIEAVEVLNDFPDEALSIVNLIEALGPLEKSKGLVHVLIIRLWRIERGLLPIQRIGGTPPVKRINKNGISKIAPISPLTIPVKENLDVRIARLTLEPKEVSEDYSNGEPLETRAEDSMVLAGGNEKDDGSTSRQRAMAGRGYRNRIALQNQLIPCQKPGLSPWEVASLICRISKNEEDSAFGIDPVLSLSIGLMLWCSVDLEDLTKVKIYRNGEYKQLAELGKLQPGFVLEGKKIIWLAKPAVCRLKTKLSDSQKVNLTDYVLLPLPKIMKKLYREYHKHTKLKGGLLFEVKNKEIANGIESFLKAMRTEEHGDYTASRISQHLFHVGINLPKSDITIAMYWSGREYYHGKVASHYTRVSVVRIRQNYGRSCLALMEAVKDDLAHLTWGHTIKELELDPSEIKDQRSESVGSIFCPDVSSIQLVLKSLKREIEQIKPLKHGGAFPDRLVDIHNGITLYTILCFALSTGARTLNNALSVPEKIDLHSGYVQISEKGLVDQANLRQVWVPPQIVTQYRLYLEHLDNVYNWLNIVSPDSAVRLKSVLCGNKADCANVKHWLFFLTETNSVQKITAKEIYRRLKGYGYTFKGNAFRHLLRTEMVRNKVAPEVINAQMGHGENGQEAWGPWSFLTVGILKKELEPFMEGHLERCSVTLVEGVGTTRMDKREYERSKNIMDEMETGNSSGQLSLF